MLERPPQDFSWKVLSFQNKYDRNDGTSIASMNYNKRKICILKNKNYLFNFTAIKIKEKAQYLNRIKI